MEPRVRELNVLLDEVLGKDAPPFYKENYRKAGVSESFRLGSLREMENIPTISLREFSSVPFRERLFDRTPSIPSVVERNGVSAVFAHTHGSINESSYGTIGVRPLAAASRIAEGIWLGMWCFGKGVLPLSAESNLELTAQLAERYGVDSLLAATEILPALLPLLARRISLTALKGIAVTGSSFPEHVRTFIQGHRGNISATLSIPEAGSIASACREQLSRGSLMFHPLRHMICEVGPTLIITRLSSLPTPLIRYDTGILVKPGIACSCREDAFVLESEPSS